MNPQLNKIANIFVPILLRSPLHRLASKRIMLISFTGRKSGKVYTTPVQYLQHGRHVIFFTQRGRVWWKNLLDHAQVALRLQGQDTKGVAKRLTLDERIIIDNLLDMYRSVTHDQAVKMAHQLVMIEVELAEERVTSAPTTTIHPAH
jgi:deazaflavin-dependent oxidoreductase (nitroreductase family)